MEYSICEMCDLNYEIFDLWFKGGNIWGGFKIINFLYDNFRLLSFEIIGLKFKK